MILLKCGVRILAIYPRLIIRRQHHVSLTRFHHPNWAHTCLELVLWSYKPDSKLATPPRIAPRYLIHVCRGWMSHNCAGWYNSSPHPFPIPLLNMSAFLSRSSVLQLSVCLSVWIIIWRSCLVVVSLFCFVKSTHMHTTTACPFVFVYLSVCLVDQSSYVLILYLFFSHMYAHTGTNTQTQIVILWCPLNFL